MNDVTYEDLDVLALLAESFVAVRVDSDARPDLAERYAEWGWPATVLLTPDGEPVTEMRGYQAPRPFAALLRDVASDLRAGRPIARRAPPPVRPDPTLRDTEALRAIVAAQLDAMYDDRIGGWGGPQKYPFAAPVEHAFFRADVRGERIWRARALQTLEGHAALVDPVWGGVYQYSVRGTWDRPHYEKIASIQAGAIRSFTEAYRVTGDERWLARARSVYGYVTAFLTSPDGAFYASQDADARDAGLSGDAYYARDDAGRRALGIPRVDTNVYASANGMLIAALIELYEATLDEEILARAVRAAERMLDTHRTGDAFTHRAGDAAILHLADQVHMARALVALHEATGEARWLDEASRTMRFVATELRDEETSGFFAHTTDPDAPGVLRDRRLPLEDGAIAARVLLRLHRLRGDDPLRDSAAAALHALADRASIRRHGRKVGELLLALEELGAPHAIVSVVGPAGSEETEALHRAALRFHHPLRMVELGRPGMSRYPYPGEPAAYLCSATACSLPVTDPARLGAAARAFLDAEWPETSGRAHRTGGLRE